MEDFNILKIVQSKEQEIIQLSSSMMSLSIDIGIKTTQSNMRKIQSIDKKSFDSMILIYFLIAHYNSTSPSLYFPHFFPYFIQMLFDFLLTIQSNC